MKMSAQGDGLKFGSVHISGIFVDDAFTYVACVRSQAEGKRMYVLTDTRIKH